MVSEHVLDYLPAYTLNALEEEELRRVDAHLEHCLDCSLALADYQEVTTRLVVLFAPAAPPIALRRRILAGVRRHARPRLHPVDVVRRHPTLVAAASMAALLLLIVTASLFWAMARLTSVEEQNQRLSQAVIQQRSTAYMVAYPGTTPFILTSGLRGGPSAVLLGSRDRDWGLLVALSMPPLEKGEVYQLWLMYGGQSFDGGTFTVDETGYGQLSLRLSEPLGAYQWARITVEPVGGSPKPTNSPLLFGSVMGQSQ